MLGLRPVDAGCGVALQALDGLGIPPGNGLFCGPKFGGNTPTLLG
jgi:hypothetical protein